MIEHQPLVTAPISQWSYDLDDPRPYSGKCLLLTRGGICLTGTLAPGQRGGYLAWAPLPARDKDKERELGIR